MAIDPVCGMEVDEKKAAATSSYKGKTYYFCPQSGKEKFDQKPEAFIRAQDKKHKSQLPSSMMVEGEQSLAGQGSGAMAKDPICGMVIPKDRSIKREVGGRTYYFCSESCVKAFESPEAELRSMRRRVTIALTGVLALAILRAAVFLGLAAGATVLTWVPIPWLPWFTWSIWLFIITTPIMIFGGKGFFIGAYHAIKDRVANMDLLIAVGTSTAYLYSTFVAFFPGVLPVKEKKDYFEGAAIIIMIVLV